MTKIGINSFNLNSSNKKLAIIGLTAVCLTIILTGQVQDISYILRSC